MRRLAIIILVGYLATLAGVSVAGVASLERAGAAVIECKELEPCDGTSEEDVLIGSDVADVIRGFEKADTLRGKPGDDALHGGSGGDELYGGGGHDFLRAGRGDDYLQTFDGVFDLIDSCGPGYDIVKADSLDFIALDCDFVVEQAFR